MVWWVSSDGCGMFSANLTVLLILYAQVVITKVVVLPWYGITWHIVVYSIFSMLALISHTRAQFSDPGSVPKNHQSEHHSNALADHEAAVAARAANLPPPRPGVPRPKVCDHCKAVKPFRAHHCSQCARCIIRMDHHCPWVNNCVALYNQKYFILFLLYIFLCCLYCAVMLVARFVSCTNNLRQCTITGVHAALCVVNFVEALIFGLFVSVMMWDQIAAIFENTPYIDSLQRKQFEKRGKYQSLKEVFGETVSWRWLLPLASTPAMIETFRHELSRDEMINLPPQTHAATATPATVNGNADMTPPSVAPAPVRASTVATTPGPNTVALLEDHNHVKSA